MISQQLLKTATKQQFIYFVQKLSIKIVFLEIISLIRIITTGIGCDNDTLSHAKQFPENTEPLHDIRAGSVLFVFPALPGRGMDNEDRTNKLPQQNKQLKKIRHNNRKTAPTSRILPSIQCFDFLYL